MSAALCMPNNGNSGSKSGREEQRELKITNLDDSQTVSLKQETEGSYFCAPRSRSRKHSDAGNIKPKVFFLDSSEKRFSTNVNYPAKHLLNKVCSYLRINESEIFGLYFRDLKNRKIWLNMSKPLSKQIKGIDSTNWMFVFRVKFYPSDVGHISEDITRYYLTLQIRNDLITQRIQASFNVCVAIAAYIVQSELGDFSEKDHGTGSKYIQDFNFIPNQSHDFMERVAEAHKTLRGFEPTETDAKLLTLAMKLSMYGQHMQPVIDKTDNAELNLSVNYSGLTVYSKKLIRNYFPWQMITKIHSNHKLFHIEVKADLTSNKRKAFVFRMLDNKVTDEFLNLVIEHHIFFRLKDPGEMVMEKSMSFMGKQNYEFNGQTMHRKWSDQNRKSVDRSETKDSVETTLPPGPPATENESTPAKNAASRSTILPIIKVNDCNSFDLKKFDFEMSQNHQNKMNSVHVEKEIVITPTTGQSVAEMPMNGKFNEQTARRSRTLSIHTRELDQHSGPIGTRQAVANSQNCGDVKSIPIAMEKTESDNGSSDSEISRTITENIKGLVQFRVDNLEAATTTNSGQVSSYSKD